MNLAKFPRIRCGHWPTPLEPMENLTRHLGGPQLWIKRDDCTGLSTGGNKTRKLEFLMADALAQKADTVITQGATQSNHARQTAAIAAKLGLACHILLEDRTGYADDAYNRSGNVLLDELHGATISKRPGGADMQMEMEMFGRRLEGQGQAPLRHSGRRLQSGRRAGLRQCRARIAGAGDRCRLEDRHAGDGDGQRRHPGGSRRRPRHAQCPDPRAGIGVRAPKDRQEANVFALAEKTCAHVGVPGAVKREHVVANCDYVGQGYGIPTEGMVEAVKLLARTEGILLDPVYSGKAMAGLIDLDPEGPFQEGPDGRLPAHRRRRRACLVIRMRSDCRGIQLGNTSYLRNFH